MTPCGANTRLPGSRFRRCIPNRSPGQRLRGPEKKTRRSHTGSLIPAGDTIGDTRRPIHKMPVPGCNDPCPCGSGKKFKYCMEHRNRCTDLRHPELLATSLLKCPRQDCCETPSETKKIGKLSPLSSFIFLTLRAYGEVFIRRLRSMGIRDRPTSPRSPWQNGYAERLIGSIRRECLD